MKAGEGRENVERPSKHRWDQTAESRTDSYIRGLFHTVFLLSLVSDSCHIRNPFKPSDANE